MSQPISRDCWENNIRLYREMNQGAASRAPEEAILFTPTDFNSNIAQSPAPAPFTLPQHGVEQLERWLATKPTNSRMAQPAPTAGGRDLQGAHTGYTIGQQRSRATKDQPGSTLPPVNANESPMALQATNLEDFSQGKPCQQISYHVNGRTSSKTLPEHLSITLPSTSQPRDPASTAAFLHLVSPQLAVVEFSCRCRSFGTCIHYQIAFDRSKVPDGLLCGICEKEKAKQNIPQLMVKGKRKCPKHQDDSGAERNHFGSRPEDFLPTREQHQIYKELLEKNMTGNRADVDRAAVRSMGRRVAKPVSRRKEPPLGQIAQDSTIGPNNPRNNEYPLPEIVFLQPSAAYPGLVRQSENAGRMPPVQELRSVTGRATHLVPLIGQLDGASQSSLDSSDVLQGCPEQWSANSLGQRRKSYRGPLLQDSPCSRFEAPTQQRNPFLGPQIGHDKVLPVSGHALMLALPRAAAQPPPEIIQCSPESLMLPTSTWPAGPSDPSGWIKDAANPTTSPVQSLTQDFFDPSQVWQDLDVELFGPVIDSEQPTRELDESAVASALENGTQRPGVRESGKRKEGNGILFADLKSIENGTPYEFDLKTFLGGSGLGAK